MAHVFDAPVGERHDMRLGETGWTLFDDHAPSIRKGAGSCAHRRGDRRRRLADAVVGVPGHLEAAQLRSPFRQRNRHHARVDSVGSHQHRQCQAEIGNKSRHRPDLTPWIAETAGEGVRAGHRHQAGGRL